MNQTKKNSRALEEPHDPHGHSHPHSHSHAHDHSHSHGPAQASLAQGLRPLLWAFFLNFGFCVFEAFGGYYSSSQAILADAFHDFGDSASILLLLIFRWLSVRPPREGYSFGYRRFNLMGSVFLAITLIIGSLFLVVQGVEAIRSPRVIQSQWMMVLAFIGVIVNGWAFKSLKLSHHHGERLLSLHFLEDLMGWLVVLLGGIVIHFTDFYWVDSLLSIGLGGFILLRAFQQLRELLRHLLLGDSLQFSMGLVEEKLRALPEVLDVHHLHVWELEPEFSVVTVHVVVGNQTDFVDIKTQVRQALSQLGPCEVTIEIEREGETCLDPLHLNRNFNKDRG